MDSRILYHYSGNEKCFKILENSSIRLSDIRKSNDYAEMQIFYPEIINAIQDEYQRNPFDFEYEGLQGNEALSALLSFAKNHIDISFDEGKITSYVLCLSEEGDLLSQWRGYADNGKGCSIGFDVEELQKFCDESKGVYRLEKIQYLSKQGIEELIKERAIFLNQKLQEHYADYKKNYPKQSARLFGKFFFGLIEEIGQTIKYKSVGFAEEKEWRLYVNDWLTKSFMGSAPGGTHGRVVKYLEDKISYHVTDNDLIPYTTFDFGVTPSRYVKSITLGPSNKIAKKDIANYLTQYKYTSTTVFRSEITFT